MNEIKTVPIRFGGITMVGVVVKTFPINHGNCFSLIDDRGYEHQVVNFVYENLKEWMVRTGQRDIKVRCIPKSDTIWEIIDDRIPVNWYRKDYCTICTPLRMLPLEQRKRYLKQGKFKKISLTVDGKTYTSVMITYEWKPKSSDFIAPYQVKFSDDKK